MNNVILPSRMKMFDWSRVKDVSPTELKELICDAINTHIKNIDNSPVIGEKFTGADSNLSGNSPVVLVQTDTEKIPDRGYELLYDLVDMRSSTSKSFDVLDVTGGVTFYQQIEGEEAKLSKIPATAKTSCSYLRFTGGFPILDDWIRFNEFYKIDQLGADTIREWYKKKATAMYALLTALTGIDQAFDTDDITTINNACANILNDLQAAGYAVDDASSFVITCNPMLKARLMKALRSTYMMPSPVAGSDRQIEFNISGVISTTKVASTAYYVSLPGYKNMRGEWEDLNTRPPQRN
ncbi:hypothetical protein H8E50_04630, partial [bacterium]|nr:hypothetical protein [bacterium]